MASVRFAGCPGITAIAVAVMHSGAGRRTPTRAAGSIYLAVGLVLTVVFELPATGPLERWRYGAALPVVPGLDVGLSPLMQWIGIPPTVLWLARRHIAGAAALEDLRSR